MFGLQLSKWTLGLMFIFYVTVIWVCASVLTQFIYSDLDFKSPFFITYISSSLFSLYLILWRFHEFMGWIKDPPAWSAKQKLTSGESAAGGSADDEDAFNCCSKDYEELSLLDSHSASSSSKRQDTSSASPSSSTSSSSSSSSNASSDVTKSKEHNKGNSTFIIMSEHIKEETTMMKYCPRWFYAPLPEDYTHMQVISVAAILCPLWFLSNFCYNYSLLYTSIGSSTIISNLSGAFTLFFSWLGGLEQITTDKLAGLALCIAGVVIVGLQDDGAVGGGGGEGGESDGQHSGFGDLMAVVGAMGYGMYTTVLKVKVEDDESVSMQLLLGYLGLINLVTLFPVVVFMWIFKFGSINLLSGEVFGLLFIQSIFDDVVSDYFWARSILLTSPTVATVGLSMTIPMGILADLLRGNFSSITPPALAGAFFVLVGFIVINVGIEPIMDSCRSCRQLMGAGDADSRFPRPSSLHDFKDSNDERDNEKGATTVN